MKILLVAPLRRRVKQDTTASRPRFVFDLASELVKQGHDVSLLGTADSYVENVKIIPVISKALNELPPFENQFYAESAYLALTAAKIKELGNEFDIIHNNSYPEFFNLLVSSQIKTPMVTTIHAPVTKELDKTFASFTKTYLVSPSRSHKDLFIDSKITKVIPHGTDTNLYSFSAKPENYLLWIGRLGKAKDEKGEFIDGKGVKTALEVAKLTNQKLLLTGNIEDEEFFERDVKPYLSEKIKWVGGLSSEQPLPKEEIAQLMQKARALLISTNFEEAFGLTAIEAISCGTPIIGYSKGAIPEILEDTVTGFLCDNGQKKEGLVEAVKKLNAMTEDEYATMRSSCRKLAEEKYSLAKMGRNYTLFYQECIENFKNSN